MPWACCAGSARKVSPPLVQDRCAKLVRQASTRTVIWTVAWLLSVMRPFGTGCLGARRRRGPFFMSWRLGRSRIVRRGWSHVACFRRWRGMRLRWSRITRFRRWRGMRLGRSRLARRGWSRITRLGRWRGTLLWRSRVAVLSGSVAPLRLAVWLLGTTGTAQSQGSFRLRFVGRPFHSR